MSRSKRRSGWISAIQRVEFVFRLRIEEIPDALELLMRFQTQPLTADIVDAGAALYRQWNPSHGCDVNDCLIAATVLETGGTIYTLNTKHYPMPGLRVLRPW